MGHHRPTNQGCSFHSREDYLLHTKAKRGNDAIFVVIDKLTKVAHFLPIKESITVAQLAELYTSRIVFNS